MLFVKLLSTLTVFSVESFSLVLYLFSKIYLLVVLPTQSPPQKRNVLSSLFLSNSYSRNVLPFLVYILNVVSYPIINHVSASSFLFLSIDVLQPPAQTNEKQTNNQVDYFSKYQFSVIVYSSIPHLSSWYVLFSFLFQFFSVIHPTLTPLLLSIFSSFLLQVLSHTFPIGQSISYSFSHFVYNSSLNSCQIYIVYFYFLFSCCLLGGEVLRIICFTLLVIQIFCFSSFS